MRGSLFHYWPNGCFSTHERLGKDEGTARRNALYDAARAAAKAVADTLQSKRIR